MLSAAEASLPLRLGETSPPAPLPRRGEPGIAGEMLRLRGRQMSMTFFLLGFVLLNRVVTCVISGFVHLLQVQIGVVVLFVVRLVVVPDEGIGAHVAALGVLKRYE